MDTTTVALKSLGNAVHTISDDEITAEVLRALGIPQSAARKLGTCLRRCAYGNDLDPDDVDIVKAMRAGLARQSDWDSAVAQVSVGAALANTADHLFEARFRLVRSRLEQAPASAPVSEPL